MTEPLITPPSPRIQRLRQRHNAERRFQFYGQFAIACAISFLAVLLLSIGWKAISAFAHFELTLEIDRPDFAERTDLAVTDLNLAVRDELLDLFPELSAGRMQRADLFGLAPRLSILPLTRSLQQDPSQALEPLTARLVVSDDLDLYLKNDFKTHWTYEVGAAGRLARTSSGAYRLSDAGPDGFVAFQDEVSRLGETTGDTLISFSDVWFELSRISGATLILNHLAGPIPDLGEQSASPITATFLGTESTNRQVSNRQIALVTMLKEQGRIEKRFNSNLFLNADSTYPELAGAAAAVAGSIFTMLVTALFSIPIGILAAVYLEEFAQKSRLTRIIEININNLAAVPSIIFGLLGAAVFLNAFGMPRSVPLVGGLVLGLLVLPTIIIASRAALRSVPPSMRDAALGLGASRTQAVFHHVLPLAAPGILTGAIIAMARALGETAPLLLIGMVAFVSEVPTSPTDVASALPVIIYKWFSGAERAWEPMTAAVIIILLVILIAMNLTAALLRRRFERRW